MSEDNIRTGTQWRKVSLGEIADIKGRIGWKGYTVGDLRDSGILVIGGAHISKDHMLCLSKATFISEEKYEESPEIKVLPGDLLMTKTGTIGNVALVPEWNERATINPNTVIIRATKICNKFLHFYLSSSIFQEKITDLVTVGAQPSLNQANLRSFLVPLPPLPEQKKIAEILSGIDRTSNLLSKQIAKEDALFTSFQDQLLESIVSTAFAPMHRHDSQLKILPIANLFEVQLGKMLNKEAKEHGHQFHYLGNKNIQQWNQDIHHLELMHFSEEEKRKFSLRSGDLLVCEGGDAGRCCVWEETDGEIYYQKAIHRLRPKSNDCTPTFMMHYLAYCKARNLLSDFISKTSISHLTREKLLEIPIAIPSREEQSSIVDKLESQRKLIGKLFSKSKILKDIKSAVSSDLLSGRKRVSDARILEGVGI